LDNDNANTKQLKQELEKIYHLISYELGSPVKSLKTMADLVMTDAMTSGNGPVTESANFMHGQIEQLQQRLGNLILWADFNVKNYSFRPVAFDLTELINKSLAHFAKPAENKGIRLVPYFGLPFQVMADPAMMTAVCHNLLSNAVKFSRKGDHIGVTALPLGDLHVQVCVRDSGIGMGAAKLAAIFNAGRRNMGRGTANEAGLGLGLLVTKAILEVHESPFRLESEMGKGLSAYFDLVLA
jgi:signal transduction histidine kinase